jgi:hypothetical protein
MYGMDLLLACSTILRIRVHLALFSKISRETRMETNAKDDNVSANTNVKLFHSVRLIAQPNAVHVAARYAFLIDVPPGFRGDYTTEIPNVGFRDDIAHQSHFRYCQHRSGSRKEHA